MRKVRIWDLPTRLFHWALAGLIALAYLSAGEEAGMALHVWAGYGIALLVVFRLVWGVVGSAHARFADFVYRPRDTARYLHQLARGRPARYAGHNPAGAAAIFAILAAIVATLWTGLSGGEDLHETLGTAVVILAFAHVAGVLLESALTGENLVRAMIDGRKSLPDADARRERPLVPLRRAAAVAAVALMLGVGAVQGGLIAWPPTAAADEAEEQEHDDEDEDEHEDAEEHEHEED